MNKNDGTKKGVSGVQHVSRVVMIVGMVLAVAVILGLTWQSIRLIKELNTPVEVKTPYNEYYQAKEYPGKTALKMVSETVPTGVDAAKWKVADDGKNDLTVDVLPKECTQIAPSKARLAYKTSQGDGVKTIVMVYGAGQARTQYDAYVRQLQQCGTDFDQKDNITTADGVALLTRGDMIVSVLSDDKGKRDSAKESYAGAIEQALTQTSCVAKDETADDAKRSFYYDREAYTGRTESQQVKVDDMILSPSVPDSLSSHNMNVNAVFVDPQSQGNVVTVPEGPLPATMEPKLPSAPVIPAIQSLPSAPSNRKTVSYQVVDEAGPGCGWTWAGQKAPVYDEQTIASNRDAILKNTRTTLQNNIKDYNRQVISWSKATALTMSFQSTWDPYVGKTTAIMDSWRKLDDARDSLRPQWFSYVDAADTWLHWDDKVATAKSDYDSSMKSCLESANSDYQKKLDEYNKKLDEWNKRHKDEDKNQDSNNNSDQNGDGGQNGDNQQDDDQNNENADQFDSDPRPTPPQKPAASDIQAFCDASVQKPEILSQEKPSRPTAPTVPADVTIPASWPTDPLKNVQ